MAGAREDLSRVEQLLRVERALDVALQRDERPRSARAAGTAAFETPMPCSPLSVPPSSIGRAHQQPDRAVDRRAARRRRSRGSSRAGCRRPRGRTSGGARPSSSPMASVRARRSAMRVRGTTTSSLSLWRASLRVAFDEHAARRPEAIALRPRPARRRRRCSRRARWRPRPRARARDSDAVAVDLDEQHGAGAQVDRHARRAHGVERRRVEHLEAARHDARGDDRAHRVAPRRARR